MNPRRSAPPFSSSVACFLLLCVFASGCGFALSHGPPTAHVQLDDFTCTESNTASIIDIVYFGSLAFILAAYEPPYGDVDPARRVIAVSGAAALGASSAIVGFNKSSRCRAAKRQLAARQSQWRVPLAVIISPSVDTLAVGEHVQLAASAHSSSGLPIPTAVFTWASSNHAVASVTDLGMVTARGIGSVMITARTDSVVGTAHLLIVGQR